MSFFFFIFVSCTSSSRESLQNTSKTGPSSNANTNINVEPSDDLIEDELDIDGDGQTVEEGDCDDNDPNIFSGAEETYYDGIDQNCDGANDYDVDGDGWDGFDDQMHEIDAFERIRDQVRSRMEDIWSNPKNPFPKSQSERERVLVY